MYMYLLGLVTGMLFYVLLELSAVVIIARYFPNKIYALQRFADAVVRPFMKSTPNEPEDTASDEPEDEEDSTANVFEMDTPVVVVDDTYGSYGVVAAKVVGMSVTSGVAYYNAKTTDGRIIRDIPEGYVAKSQKIIPEGAPVRIVVSETYDGGLVNGVTFRASVACGDLLYVVEYPNGDDVAQTTVSADEIWERETKA